MDKTILWTSGRLWFCPRKTGIYEHSPYRVAIAVANLVPISKVCLRSILVREGCDSPDHLQGPKPGFFKIAVEIAAETARGNSGCWGSAGGTAGRTAVALRNRETAASLVLESRRDFASTAGLEGFPWPAKLSRTKVVVAAAVVVVVYPFLPLQSVLIRAFFGCQMGWCGVGWVFSFHVMSNIGFLISKGSIK